MKNTSHATGSLPPTLMPPTEKGIISNWSRGLENPLVSIVCHTYQHAPYIESALKGFLAQQTSFPFEIIVHDDFSSDGTEEIIENYAKKYPNLIRAIFQKENQYKKGFRPPNFTYHKARGTYVALCEGDDYWCDPKKLAKQVEHLEVNKHLDLCVHPAVQWDMNRDQLSILGCHGKRELTVPVSKVLEGKKHFAPTASYLMRRDAMADLPGWFFKDPDLPVGDFFLEAIIGRKSIAYLPNIMSVYRLGVPGSHSARFRLRNPNKAWSDYCSYVQGVESLNNFPEICSTGVASKKLRLQYEYADLFLKMGNYNYFEKVAPESQWLASKRQYALFLFAKQSSVTFNIARYASGFLNYGKKWVKIRLALLR